MAGESDTPAEPNSISNVYSDMEMRMRLATKASATPCSAEACEENQLFDARVQQLGEQLSAKAFEIYPNLQKQVQKFTFGVVEKTGAGTASNNKGNIVIFRGLQDMMLSDEALEFIIAREMGHVIGKHHVTNTSTKLIISALASVIFPAAAIIGASSTAAQASSATSLLTSAASTATSMVGSEVAMSRMKPSQLMESDEIAIKLLVAQDSDMQSIASVLQSDPELLIKNGWERDLDTSQQYLQAIVDKDNLALEPLEAAAYTQAEEPVAP